MKRVILALLLVMVFVGQSFAQFTAPDLDASVTTYVLPIAIAAFAALAVIWPLRKGVKFLNRS
jgi:hypothetical protein